jgi:hypothetical protein
VIEKTIQTSSTFWVVKVRNTGNGDSTATTLKMVAMPGGSYSCPVAAIKSGRHRRCALPDAVQGEG